MNLQEIIQQLNEVYEGKPWFGNSISAYLQELTPDMLHKHIEGGHSIGQIIEHMIVWREYVIDKLEHRPNTLEVGSENDWPGRDNNNHKTELYTKFKSTQKKLNYLLQKANDNLLEELVPDTSITFKTLLIGITQHDIYHLGQIYLLKNASIQIERIFIWKQESGKMYYSELL